MPIAHNLGFPHLGAARELKRATEGYWGGKVSLPDLLKTGAELRARHWRLQQDAGIDLIPSNDFSYYDRVLDTCTLVGAVPKRYGWAGGPTASRCWTRCCRCTRRSCRASPPPAPPGFSSTSRASRSTARPPSASRSCALIDSWRSGCRS